jgi:TolB-like protein/Tfp pilus assembly protein PilF
MGRFQHVIAELRRRRVFRALAVWGLVSFAVLQVFEPVMHGLHLPEWTLSLMVVLLGLGFPVAAALGWAFDLTVDGLERTRPVEPAPGAAPALPPGFLPRKAALLVGLGLAAAAPGLVYFFVWPGPARRLAGSPASAAGAAASTAQAPAAPSIAVLPLVNLTSDKEQEYFSDGLTEELLNLLAKVPGLRVAARTSAFAFKGKNEDLRSVAQQLNVAHVLEGSVRRAGDRIRITTQLINAADGYHLWSETYDRKVTDVFAVQDEIAAAVVAALKVQLLRAPTSQDRRTASPEAYNQYLLGRQHTLRSNLEGRRLAMKAYGKAIELDPGYAPAWAGLAMAEFWVADMAESAAAIAAGQVRALAAADQAVALRPDLADGYRARGFLRSMVRWDWAGAEEDLRRALALEPDNPDALSAYAEVVLIPKGRKREAAETLRRAADLDPLNAGLWDALSEALIDLGELGPARQAVERSLEISPSQSFAPVHLALIQLLEGRPADALTSPHRSTEEVFRLLVDSLAHHELGHAAEASRLLGDLEARFAYGAAYQIAEAHAWRGEPDLAFRWLERARAQHDTGLAFLKCDVLLRRLHGDPRWPKLLESLRLPPD